jgi:hypothetical protein
MRHVDTSTMREKVVRLSKLKEASTQGCNMMDVVFVINIVGKCRIRMVRGCAYHRISDISRFVYGL